MGIVEIIILFGWAGTALLAVALSPWTVAPPVVIGVLLLLLRRPTRYGVALA